jgi:non-specific serine/threonine protein kinase
LSVNLSKKLDDLWSQMQFINPNILSFFCEHYSSHWEKQDETSLLEQKPSQSVYFFTSDQKTSLKTSELSEQVFYCDMEPEQEKLYEEEKSKARNAL